MKQPKIERALAYLDDQYIKEACDFDANGTEHPAPSRRSRSRAAWLILAASLVLVLSGTFLLLRLIREDPATTPPATVIAFDVNPSLELQIDRDRMVTDMQALNADAETVLSDTDLVGLPLESAVDHLVAALLHHGYLNAEHNAILVSVDGEDTADAEALRASLYVRITEQLKDRAIEASVITQTYDRTETAAPLPAAQEISTAKAALIRKIRAAAMPGTEDMTYEELALMSIDDLNRIIVQNPHLLVEGLDAMRTMFYNLLAPQDALQAVLRSAQVRKSEVSDLTIDLSPIKAYPICVYVIQFATEENAYRYQIVGGEMTAGTLCAVGDIIERRTVALRDSATLWDFASVRDQFLHKDEVWTCVRTLEGIGVGENNHFTLTLGEIYGGPAYTVTFTRESFRCTLVLDAYTGELLYRTMVASQ